MGPRELEGLSRELTSFLDEMLQGMGRRERRDALRLYLTGLLLDGERKSVQPMAARLADSAQQAEALRQRLQQAVVMARWGEAEVYRRLACKLAAELPGIDALILDDTGFKKSGSDSVGVARQYSGTWGRTDNGQVAVSLHLAGEEGSGMIGLRLYLPQQWTQDAQRCAAAGVPADVAFAPKWKLGLHLLDQALDWGVRRHVVLGDAAFGDVPAFRDALQARRLPYLLRVGGAHRVWPPGSHPVVPEYPGMGRPPTLPTDASGAKPLAIADVALALRYRKLTWREGSAGQQASYFAFARVRMAEQHERHRPPSDEVWLVCEWPAHEALPTKYYLCNLPPSTSHRRLVQLAKRRWRVERDYQELKGELGLDHYEGRTWNGFHHHAALCALAHGFLCLRRALFPPERHAVDAAPRATPPPATPPRAPRLLPPVQAAH
jgi:SRSO17 transposase